MSIVFYQILLCIDHLDFSSKPIKASDILDYFITIFSWELQCFLKISLSSSRRLDLSGFPPLQIHRMKCTIPTPVFCSPCLDVPGQFFFLISPRFSDFWQEFMNCFCLSLSVHYLFPDKDTPSFSAILSLSLSLFPPFFSLFTPLLPPPYCWNFTALNWLFQI